MQKLIDGIIHFQNNDFKNKVDLFKKLAKGQNPIALFVTCSDSRVNPNLLTQTEPGEIFVLRNAGNIVPPPPHCGGEIATIEFAIEALGISDVIVCGHSDCGAMKGILQPHMISSNMPNVLRWLKNAEAVRDIVTKESHKDPKTCLLTKTVEQNILTQIDNLKSHRFIQRHLDAGKIKIHGWYYRFESGDVLTYDSKSREFIPLVSKQVSYLEEEYA